MYDITHIGIDIDHYRLTSLSFRVMSDWMQMKLTQNTSLQYRIKRHLLTEFYLVSAIDIFVVLSCIWILILCFLSSA